MKKILSRNQEIAELHKKKVTQQEIAKKYGITRQRVQQIESLLGLDRKKEIVEHSNNCKMCEKSFVTKYVNRKYCSRLCSSNGRKIVRTPEEQVIFDAEFKEKRRIRSRDYYRKFISKK